MSDSYIDLVPTDPAFVPADVAGLETLVRGLFPRADLVEASVGEHIVFHDAGANFSAVSCPACGADLIEDWTEMMQDDFDGDGFVLSAHPLSCCGVTVTLADLVYDPPMGFSRTVVSVRNPDVAEVPEAMLRAVGERLGCPVRAIYRHI